MADEAGQSGQPLARLSGRMCRCGQHVRVWRQRDGVGSTVEAEAAEGDLPVGERMAGDFMKKVATGDPLSIKARWYNAVTDATVAYKRARQGLGQDALDVGLGAGMAWIQNNSGDDRKRFEILGIDTESLLDPSSDLNAFKNRLVFKGVMPK